MSPRNTTTGRVLEDMILPSLRRGGYNYATQVHMGNRIGGRKHLVDVVAEKDKQSILVSLKWQQVSGTAEQKVPFEVISLMDAVLTHSDVGKAYLVLGGNGWTLRNFYTTSGLKKYLKYENSIEICTLEDFIAKANEGKL